MKLYTIKIHACQRNAIGITQVFERQISAMSEDEAILKLYNEFDHIRVISIEGIDL